MRFSLISWKMELYFPHDRSWETQGRRTQHRAGLPGLWLPCSHIFPRRALPHLQSGSKAPAPRGSEGARRKAPACLVEGDSPPRNLNLQAARGGSVETLQGPSDGWMSRHSSRMFFEQSPNIPKHPFRGGDHCSPGGPGKQTQNVQQRRLAGWTRAQPSSKCSGSSASLRLP